MSVIKSVLLCAVGFTWLVGTPAGATPINFDFTLTVTRASIDLNYCDVWGGFACATSAGDTFVGHGTVANSVLMGDGIKDGVPTTNFFIKIGRVAWDQTGGDPDNFFFGFRDSNGQLGATSPGYVVSGGALVDLRGGVIGGADIPFIDFTTFSPHRFIAFDSIGSSEINGSLRMGTVPEPSTLLLTLLGTLSLCAVARARAHCHSSSGS